MLQKILCVLFLSIYLSTCFFTSAQSDTAQHKNLPDSASFQHVLISECTHLETEIHFPVPMDYYLPFFFNNFFSIHQLSVFNGNAGSPAKLFSQINHTSDDFFNPLPFHRRLISDIDKIVPLITDNPASLAYYSSGKNKEQHFHFFHTQRIDSSFSFSLNYNLINAPGLYTNQRTNQSHFYGYILYRTKNNRYNAMAGVFLNKILQKENGGISVPEQFEDSTVYDRQFTLVDFITAERKYKDAGYFISGKLALNREESNSRLFITHSSSLKTYKNVFADSDPLNSPYPQVLFDSVATYDSTYISLLTNRIFLTNVPFSENFHKKIVFWAGYQLQNAIVKQKNLNNSFTSSQVSAGFEYKLPAEFKFSSSLKYSFGTFNHGNVLASAHISKAFRGKFFKSAGVEVELNAIDPQYVYRSYISNHYAWDNDFSTQKISGLSLLVKSIAGDFKAEILSLSDYVYLDENALPHVFTDNTTVFHVGWTSTFTPGLFFIESEMGLNILPEDSPVRLPEFYAQLKAGIGFPMFKKALEAFIGFESIYFTGFYADSWSLATGLFYLQNTTEVGNYFYPGVFVGIKIKRARIFIMMDNPTAGLFEMNYYSMPDYPRYDRFLRWGLSWSFFN